MARRGDRPADRRHPREPFGLPHRLLDERGDVPLLGGPALRIPGRLLQSEQGISRGHWSDLREGFTAFRSTALRVALYGFGLTIIASGLVNVSEIFLATRSLGSSRGFGYGLLWTGSGVGLVAGSIVTGFLLERHNVLNIYALAFVPLTVGILGAAVGPTSGLQQPR